ncbi:MAG: hypothetical protein WBB07_16225, partial [Mycobacterium sp.]
MQAVGLSVGATTLAAVTSDAAVLRAPVLTVFRRRPPMLGRPGEYPQLPGDDPGLVVTDFVDRVGDPVGILASDGSSHHSERVLAEALHALTYVAGGHRRRPEVAAVTHPAHWRPAAVAALQHAVA